MRRTLAILHRDGFLYRAPHFDAAHDRGVAGHVYGLCAKGVDHALRNGYSTPATKTLDEHSIRTLDHELEVTSLHIALHRLCTAKGIRFLSWQKDLKHTIHPDALFYVADPANAGKAFCYFLEIERAKLGNYRNGEPQILRKLRKYYDYFNSTDCEKEWGFDNTGLSSCCEATPGGTDSSMCCERRATTVCSGSRQKTEPTSPISERTS